MGVIQIYIFVVACCVPFEVPWDHFVLVYMPMTNAGPDG